MIGLGGHSGRLSMISTHVREVADARRIFVVAVAEHGYVDQMRRRRIISDLCIDAGEVDLLVEPAAGPMVAGIGHEVREAADDL
jgi:hypothetical protein